MSVLNRKFLQGLKKQTKYFAFDKVFRIKVSKRKRGFKILLHCQNLQCIFEKRLKIKFYGSSFLWINRAIGLIYG